MKNLPLIMIVEDDPNDLELIVHAFQNIDRRIEMITMRNGREALDYLFAQGIYAGQEVKIPHAIILDLDMPEVDGLQVLKTIKSDESLNWVPVVIFTSANPEYYLERCYDYGSNSFVQKPLSYQDYVHTISHLVEFWGFINRVPQEV